MGGKPPFKLHEGMLDFSRATAGELGLLSVEGESRGFSHVAA